MPLNLLHSLIILLPFFSSAYPLYDQFWIGLTDQTTEMYYEWIDNTDVTYTAWNYYEPNNVGEEDCAELYVPTVSRICHAA